MKDNKKPYKAPFVKKVRLVVKNAVLGICHASPNQDPKLTLGCVMEPTCYVGRL